MKRYLVAVDVQPFFKPHNNLVERISALSSKIPTLGTVFEHDETRVPFHRILGEPGPRSEDCLVPCRKVFRRSGYILPRDLLVELRQARPDEVIVCGGFSDERVLAAGFSLFEAGLKPVVVPELCYDNDWFQHTVTLRLWEKSVGKVYESLAEISAD